MKTTEKQYAMGVVNQLYDLANVAPKTRQSINDVADDFMVERLRSFRSENPTAEPTDREIYEAAMKHLESKNYNETNTVTWECAIAWYKKQINRP